MKVNLKDKLKKSIEDKVKKSVKDKLKKSVKDKLKKSVKDKLKKSVKDKLKKSVKDKLKKSVKDKLKKSKSMKDKKHRNTYKNFIKIFYNSKKLNKKIYIKNSKEFLKLFKNFDSKFYKKTYNDLKKMNDIQLMSHYYFKGRKENRISSLKDFNTKYTDFEIIYYKIFNKELNNLNDIELVIHFINIGNNDNKKYLNFDFKVENYYDEIKRNNKFYNLVKKNINYRSIKNIEQLIIYRSKYENKHWIYNKELFFKYYINLNFNLEFYKNTYFKDIDISELDLLLDYHNVGKFKKRLINDKIKIIIYTPPFDIKCGGIVVMHYLAKVINDLNNPKFKAKLFIYNNLKYDNIFCNDFATIDELDDNTIVIYPETITGNPLNCKNVVRWILLELGIEMPLDHYINWGEKDLIYHWETKENTKQLCCPWLNPLFYNKNLKRDKTCYIIKKGRLIHKDIKFYHDKNSINIESLSLNKICEIFNKSTYFYCYDPNTAYIIYAVLCGCIPIIYPIKGISKDDYFKNRMTYRNGIIYNKGICWGNSENEIKKAKSELNNNINIYYKNLFDSYKETVINFLEELKYLEKNNFLNTLDTLDTIDRLDTLDTIDRLDTLDSLDTIDRLDTLDIIDIKETLDIIDIKETIDIIDIKETIDILNN